MQAPPNPNGAANTSKPPGQSKRRYRWRKSQAARKAAAQEGTAAPAIAPAMPLPIGVKNLTPVKEAEVVPENNTTAILVASDDTADASSSSDTEPKPNLLTIPREIRDMIYNLVLDEGVVAVIGPFRRWMRPSGDTATKYVDSSGNTFLRLHEDNYKQIERKVIKPVVWSTPLSPIRSPQNVPAKNAKAVDLLKVQGPLFPTLPLIIVAKKPKKSKTEPEPKFQTPLQPKDPNKVQHKVSTKNQKKYAKRAAKKLAAEKAKQPIIIKKPGWSTNTALLFTCRQTHTEFAKPLYSKTVFCFGARQPIVDFAYEMASAVNHAYPIPKKLPVTTENLQHINFLALDCRSEGMSRLLAQTSQQGHSYQFWEYCCAMIATRMESLTDLTLSIEVPWNAPSRQLSLQAFWAKPFLAFSKSKSLRSVSINIVIYDQCNFEVQLPALDAFAEMMRRKILRWDHASALETITEYKENASKFKESKNKKYWDKTWANMELWNKDDEDKDDKNVVVTGPGETFD